MTTAQHTSTHTTNKHWGPLNNQEFEKMFVRDTLITFSAGLIIAGAVITGLFYLADFLVH